MLIKSYSHRMERHEEKTRIMLHFLRDETWSSAYILADLLGLSKTGIYKTLRFLEGETMIRSHYVSELKMKIYGITPTGLLYAWNELELMEERPCFEPGRVKPLMMMHYLDTQRARLRAERSGWTNWVPGHLLSKGLTKRPDAVVINCSGQKIAVELERTVKSKRRYESIFAEYFQAIKRKEYDYIHYVCSDVGFSIRLARLFNLIETVPIAGQRVSIGDKHRARLPIYALANWPPNHTELMEQ